MKKSGFIIPLLLIIAAIIIIGGGVYVYHEKTNIAVDNQTTATSTVTTSASNTTTVPITVEAGIKGSVSIGPTCPVQIDNDVQNTCSDKPYATTFEVLSLSGQFVKNFSSDVEGNFSVQLQPGTYKIVQANPKIYPKLSVVESVTVKSGTYTTLNLSFDSGIR